MRTVAQVDPSSHRIIVRVDWNVPFTPDGTIADTRRIVASFPTLSLLLEKGASQIVLLAHLGKAEEKKSLKPVVQTARILLEHPIVLHDSIEQCLHDTSSRILMLENLRLFPGEDANDPAFARDLATLGDFYVNEAFGESHRESASIIGLSTYLTGYAGLRLAEEVKTILKVRTSADHPSILVMGGAKVNDKIALLEKMSHQVDVILLGGKLANEFVARRLALGGSARVLTPVDGVGNPYLDIGPQTCTLYAKELHNAKTIIWNGPMGKVEDVAYQKGTDAIYDALVANQDAFTLVGGGDTLSSISHEQHTERIDYISTGGGAMLKLLETGDFPALHVLHA